jgi:hypothetical protein
VVFSEECPNIRCPVFLSGGRSEPRNALNTRKGIRTYDPDSLVSSVWSVWSVVKDSGPARERLIPEVGLIRGDERSHVRILFAVVIDLGRPVVNPRFNETLQ